MSLQGDYFDRMYAGADDPWGFATRWYEQRKYALTFAALPAPVYSSALEIGCSIGILTVAPAARCSSLVALDPSAAALRSTATRVPPWVRLLDRVEGDLRPGGTVVACPLAAPRRGVPPARSGPAARRDGPHPGRDQRSTREPDRRRLRRPPARAGLTVSLPGS